MKGGNMNRKGFTLVELIIVVIIIGILATIAIPQYIKAVERAKGGKAKSMLGMYLQANKMYYAQNSSYTTSLANLQNYVEVVASDGDWTYTAAADGSATAARSGGNYAGNTIKLDMSGTYTVTGTGPYN
jgi:prepilin-type N-terminal cleavage/methylation domain-containing protein